MFEQDFCHSTASTSYSSYKKIILSAPYLVCFYGVVYDIREKKVPLTFHRPNFHRIEICPNCSPECQFTKGKVHRLFELRSPIRWKNNTEKMFQSCIHWFGEKITFIFFHTSSKQRREKNFIGLCGGWEFGIFPNPTDIPSNVTSQEGRVRGGLGNFLFWGEVQETCQHEETWYKGTWKNMWRIYEWIQRNMKKTTI